MKQLIDISSNFSFYLARVFIFLVKKIKNSTDFEKTIATGVLFVFIGFLIAGMFGYNFGDTEIKIMLFYFLSIPFVTLKEKKEEADVRERGKGL